MNIKAKVKAFIKEYSLNSSRVSSFEELQKVAVRLGYKVYSPYDLDDWVLIELNAVDVYQANAAFCYADGDVKYIIIHPDLPNEIAATLILHELAHIYLGHLKNSTMPAESDEAETKLFVSYVLKEIFSQRISFTVLNSVLCTLTAIMLIVSVYISQRDEPIAEVDTTTISAVTITDNISDVTESTDVPEVTDITNITSDDKSEIVSTVDSVSTADSIVFVTKDGEKYHKPDCYHIAGRNVIELTISEAEAAKYEPCKDCFPQYGE